MDIVDLLQSAPGFVFLYQHYGPAPFIINAMLLSGMLVYAFRSTALRNADPKPASREEVTLATLEKTDEAGSASNWVIERSSSKRSSISSRSSRATRSVPNSSTLKEASTVP